MAITNEGDSVTSDKIIKVALLQITPDGANYPQPLQNGHSCAFDAWGEKNLEADESEGIFIVRFDMNEIRDRRKKTNLGNAYRRPQKYQLLISPEVDTIFIRNNGIGEKFDRGKR